MLAYLFPAEQSEKSHLRQHAWIKRGARLFFRAASFLAGLLCLLGGRLGGLVDVGLQNLDLDQVERSARLFNRAEAALEINSASGDRILAGTLNNRGIVQQQGVVKLSGGRIENGNADEVAALIEALRI